MTSAIPSIESRVTYIQVWARKKEDIENHICLYILTDPKLFIFIHVKVSTSYFN